LVNVGKSVRGQPLRKICIVTAPEVRIIVDPLGNARHALRPRTARQKSLANLLPLNDGAALDILDLLLSTLDPDVSLARCNTDIMLRRIAKFLETGKRGQALVRGDRRRIRA
jgi:hypothetical protein